MLCKVNPVKFQNSKYIPVTKHPKVYMLRIYEQKEKHLIAQMPANQSKMAYDRWTEEQAGFLRLN